MPPTLKDFDFELPEELIAQAPLAHRGASRLLHLHGASVEHLRFHALPGLLAPGELLVLNDTRVLKARLSGVKASGGRVEVLIERVLGEHEAFAQIRASKPPRAGARLALGGGVQVEVLERLEDMYRIRFAAPDPVHRILERHGVMPLPPYIRRDPCAGDEERYQTVYARAPGAVAAPTAGLHFDRELLGRLERAGVGLAWLTLHVGAGTFQPVRAQDPGRHRMHPEWFCIPRRTREAVLDAKRRGARVTAVGTTVLRALESAASVSQAGVLSLAEGEAETRLFVLPGYRFRVVERLITNFHLPKSTLFMLACAFGGTRAVRRAYEAAIRERYRFFSYGDAMLIDREAT